MGLSESVDYKGTSEGFLFCFCFFLFFVFCFFLFVCFVLFFETGFRCSFGVCPQTHRDPLASASQVLGLTACATTARREGFYIDNL